MEGSALGGYYPPFDSTAIAPTPLPFGTDDGNCTSFYGGAGLLSDAILYTSRHVNSSVDPAGSLGLPQLQAEPVVPAGANAAGGPLERPTRSLGFADGGEEEVGVSAILSSYGDSIWNMSCSGNASSGESEGTNTQMTTTITQPNYTPNPNEAVSVTPSKRPAFKITFGGPPSKRARRQPEEKHASSRSIDFRWGEKAAEADPEALAQVKEMIYRAAAFRPVVIGAEEAVEKPKRKNVRISSDPQTVAARHRRERISERLRVLQRLVPGGSKLDTASMLDEAANYLKFLKSQVTALEKKGGGNADANGNGVIACGLLTAASSSPLTSSFLLPQPPFSQNPDGGGMIM